jgi:hypothetical protein
MAEGHIDRQQMKAISSGGRGSAFSSGDILRPPAGGLRVAFTSSIGRILRLRRGSRGWPIGRVRMVPPPSVPPNGDTAARLGVSYREVEVV